MATTWGGKFCKRKPCVQNEHLKIIVRKLFDDKVGWVAEAHPTLPEWSERQVGQNDPFGKAQEKPRRGGARIVWINIIEFYGTWFLTYSHKFDIRISNSNL